MEKDQINDSNNVCFSPGARKVRNITKIAEFHEFQHILLEIYDFSKKCTFRKKCSPGGAGAPGLIEPMEFNDILGILAPGGSKVRFWSEKC